MKTSPRLPRSFSACFILFILFTGPELIGQVGIGTLTPTETLHVNGNTRIDGAFMPGNITGVTDQILISKGAGNPPAWGPGFLNTPQFTNFGKYFSGLFNSVSGTVTAVTIIDPNMTVDSFVYFNFVGPLPAGPQYSNNFRIFAEPQAGQVVFYVTNSSLFTINNLQIAFFAVYH